MASSGLARKGGGKNDPPKRAGDKSSKGPASPSHNSNDIFQDLSFYVRIQPLSPNYESEPIRSEGGGHWVPPNTPAGLTDGEGPAILLRWEAGNVAIVPGNDPIRHNGLENHLYKEATVFTQAPDTPHLLAVPFNAMTRSVAQYGRGWHRITFNHIRVQGTTRYYSYISVEGARLHIAAPRAPHWTPGFLPPWYNCESENRTRTQAGLIGELPLLFALAAFSAPPTSQGSFLGSIRPRRWVPHGRDSGHIGQRGMVVTIYFDPSNPAGSNSQILNRLQDGDFGPFYGPN